MKHSINSPSHCTVQQQVRDKAVRSARHEAVLEDRPKTILKTRNSFESISITAVLLLSRLPCSSLIQTRDWQTIAN